MTRSRIGRGCGPLDCELDLALAHIGLDVVEPFEEIEIPRDAPVFAVGDRTCSPTASCLRITPLDLAILDLLERVGGDLAALRFSRASFSGAVRSRLPT